MMPYRDTIGVTGDRKYAACGKICLDKETADQLIKKAKKECRKLFGNTNRQEKRTYWCSLCKAYHLTSIPQHEWDAIKKEKRENKKKRDREIIELLKSKPLSA